MRTVRSETFQLIFSFQDRIRRYFVRHVSNVDDIEDLTQDVICALIESHRRFRRDSSPATWIYAICKNHLYNYYRSKKRNRDLTSRMVGRYPTSNEDVQAAFDIALDRLTIQERRLFIDFYRDRKQIRDIAAQMEKPEGTIKYLLYALRSRLRNILG